jgi:hypothetical protein
MIQYANETYKDLYDLLREPVKGRMQPTLLAYFNDDRGYQFLNEDQTSLFCRQLDYDPSWRIDIGSVKDFAKARSIKAIKKETSMNNFFLVGTY